MSLPQTTGTKGKHHSTSGPLKANYCTMLTVVAQAAQFPDGPYEAQAYGFMWCTVCDVVIRHDHKTFGVSHMNCKSEHKARIEMALCCNGDVERHF